MENELVVEVEGREQKGKNASRRLRRGGMVPGIVYGLDRPPFPVAVSSRQIDSVLHQEAGRNTVFTLALTGESRSRAVMIKDLQRDPVTENLVHVDFVRIDLKRKMHVRVPIRLQGTPQGVKTDHGILEFILREVSVECLPSDIPEHLDLDVSALHINQHVSVGDLQVGDRVRLLEDVSSVIAVVAPPRVEEEAAAATGEEEEAPAEAAQEPEVIKKSKEEAPEPESGSAG